MPRSKPRSKPRSAEERRSEIIAATIPLLEQEGFGVSTKRIADAAGIAEGTVFRVFSTKEELLRAALTSYLDPRDAVSQIESIDLAIPLADKVERIVTIIQESGSRIHLFMMALRHHSQVDPKAGRWADIFHQAVPTTRTPTSGAADSVGQPGGMVPGVGSPTSAAIATDAVSRLDPTILRPGGPQLTESCPISSQGESDATQFSHHHQFGAAALVIRDRVARALETNADELVVDPTTAAMYIVLTSMTSLMGAAAMPIDRSTLVHLTLRAVAVCDAARASASTHAMPPVERTASPDMADMDLAAATLDAGHPQLPVAQWKESE